MSDPFKTYGPGELCAWKVEKLGGSRDVFWFQTTDKAFTRKLSKRRDTCRIGVTGYNHFRQTFAMEGDWRKVKRIIDRYISSAADPLLAKTGAHDASSLSDRVATTGHSHPPVLAVPNHKLPAQSVLSGE